VRDAWLDQGEGLTFQGRNALHFRLPGPTQDFRLLRADLQAVGQHTQPIRWPLSRIMGSTGLDNHDNRPIVLYFQDGTYLGERTTINHDVHIITQNLTEDVLEKGTEWEILEAVFTTVNLTSASKVSFREFLDRAHWAYGECAGSPGIVNHYAHVINNLMNDPKSKALLYNRHKKLLFFEPGHGPNGNYNRFARARRNPQDLNTMSNGKVTIAATIGAILGTTDNPIGEARLWRGGETAEIFQRRHLRNLADPLYKDVTFLETGKTKKFQHFFFNYTDLGRRKLRESREGRRGPSEDEPDDVD
jgi:hypothetical protein